MAKRTRKIALQRMETLYKLSKETVHTELELAQRYITLLRKISQRTQTKIPLHIRKGFCRKCNTPLIPGLNSQTRIRQKREPHVATTCQTCGNITRIPLRSREK